MTEQQLLYIEKTKATWYSAGAGEPKELSFPQDTLNNMEIIDREKFQSQVTAFLQENKIKPTPIMIILAPDTTFEKNLDSVASSLQSNEVEKFLEIIPFNTILSKVYKVKNHVIAIATNKEIYEVIAETLENASFEVLGIVPLVIIQEILPMPKESIDIPMIMKKIDILRQYNLLDVVAPPRKIVTVEKPKFRSFQFTALISTFAVLILIFLFLIYTRFLR